MTTTNLVLTGETFLDLGYNIGSLSFENQTFTVKGSTGSNAFYLRPAGYVFDYADAASATGSDRIYLTGNRTDYSASILEGILTLTRGTGATAETVKVRTADPLNLVFRDGYLAANAVSPAGGETLATSETSLKPSLPTNVAGSVLIGSDNAAGQSNLAGMQGQAFTVVGNGGVEKVYVTRGAMTDARRLGVGKDLIYLEGKWGDYTKALTGSSITLTRDVTNGLTQATQTEKVIVTGGFGASNDQMIFADGAIDTRAALVAMRTSGTSVTTDGLANDWSTATTSASSIAELGNTPFNFKLMTDTGTLSDYVTKDGTILVSTHPGMAWEYSVDKGVTWASVQPGTTGNFLLPGQTSGGTGKTYAPGQIQIRQINPFGAVGEAITNDIAITVDKIAEKATGTIDTPIAFQILKHAYANAIPLVNTNPVLGIPVVEIVGTKDRNGNALTSKTWEFWHKADASDFHAQHPRKLFSVRGQNGTTGFDADFQWNYGSLNAVIQPWGGTLTQVNAPSTKDNKWHHVALSYNSETGSAAVFYDGKAITSWDWSGFTTFKFGLGSVSDSGNAYHHSSAGFYRDVTLWDYAKSSSQIVGDKDTASFTGTEQGLIGYWKLNEASGIQDTNNSLVYYGKNAVATLSDASFKVTEVQDEESVLWGQVAEVNGLRLQDSADGNTANYLQLTSGVTSGTINLVFLFKADGSSVNAQDDRFFRADAGGNFTQVIGLSNGNFVVNTPSGFEAIAAGDDNWHYWRIQYTTTNCTIYIDGSEKLNVNGTYNLNAGLQLGGGNSSADGLAAAGLYREVALYHNWYSNGMISPAAHQGFASGELLEYLPLVSGFNTIHKDDSTTGGHSVGGTYKFGPDITPKEVGPKPIISGKAEAFASVDIIDGTTTLATAKADGSGNWSVQLQNALSGTLLLTLKATDVAGNVSELTEYRVINTDIPATPTLDSASNSGATDDSRTNATQPTFTGTLPAGTSAGTAVAIYLDGSTTAAVSVTASGTADGLTVDYTSGTWSYTPPAALGGSASGTAHSIQVGVGTVKSDAHQFVIDTSASVPTITSDLPTALDVDSKLVMFGTAEPGSTSVKVTISDGTNTVTKDAVIALNGDGTTSWNVSFLPGSSGDYGSLADGVAATVTVEVTDAAGNTASLPADIGPHLTITGTTLSTVTALDVRTPELVLEIDQAAALGTGKITLRATTTDAGFDSMAAPQDLVITLTKDAQGVVTADNATVTLSTDGKKAFVKLKSDLDLGREYSVELDKGVFVLASDNTVLNTAVLAGKIGFSTVLPSATGQVAKVWDATADSGAGGYVDGVTWFDGTTGSAGAIGLGGTTGLDVSAVKSVVVIGRDTDSSATGVTLAHASYSKLTGFGGDDLLYVDIATGGTINNRINEDFVSISDNSADTSATSAITSLDFSTEAGGSATVDITFADNSSTTTVTESDLTAIALDASANTAVTLGTGENDFKTLTGEGTPVISG